MGRIFGLVYLNKNLITLMIMAALMIAGLFIIRQIHHASAAASSSQAQVLESKPIKPSLPLESPADASGDASSQNSNHTSLTVNGRPIEVPENGSVNQTLDDGNSTTTINAENSTSSTTSQGSASNTNNSSVNVNVHSSSGGSQ